MLYIYKTEDILTIYEHLYSKCAFLFKEERNEFWPPTSEMW